MAVISVIRDSRIDLCLTPSSNRKRGLHPDPYNDQIAPWIKPGGIDEQLRHVYLSNYGSLILERYREGSIEAVYNLLGQQYVDRRAADGFCQ